MNSGVELYGTDISANSLKNLSGIAAFLRKNINAISIDEFDVNNSERKFDIISCSHVLEHVADDNGLLKKFYTKLENGGTLLLNIPINEVWKDPKHIRNYTLVTAQDILDQLGFTVKEIFQTDRLTTWFLLNEQSGYTTKIKKIIFRAMRLFFSIMPLRILFLADRLLPKKYPFQQLIIIAKKND